MKLDKALKNFTEKYDRTAMEYIEKVSSEFGLVYNKQTLPSFDMSGAFDKFCEYLEGYADYKIRMHNEDGSKELSQDEITSTTKKWCENVFNTTEEYKLKYDEIPAFIESYIKGVNKLITTIESNKTRLMEEGVDLGSVGIINDYSDMFMDQLEPRFEATMNKILLASGYTTAQRLSGKSTVKDNTPYFI